MLTPTKRHGNYHAPNAISSLFSARAQDPPEQRHRYRETEHTAFPRAAIICNMSRARADTTCMCDNIQFRQRPETDYRRPRQEQRTSTGVQKLANFEDYRLVVRRCPYKACLL